jgi:hypothetical protein
VELKEIKFGKSFDPGDRPNGNITFISRREQVPTIGADLQIPSPLMHRLNHDCVALIDKIQLLQLIRF